MINSLIFQKKDAFNIKACHQYKQFIKIIKKRMEKTILLFGLIFAFCLSLKMVPLSEIQDVYFSTITGIDYDDKVGKFTSPKNSLIYFFIQGLNNNQQHGAFRKMQIESVRIAYHQSQIDSAFSQQQSQSQQTKDFETQPIDNDKQSETLSSNKEPYRIEFFIVRCLLSLQESNSICQYLGLNGHKNQTLIFFTQRSQIIEYKSQIRQDKILYFLSKVKENSDYGNSDIRFDAELESMAQKFSFQNKTVQQHAFSFIELIKSYLTMEVLLFVLVFIVVPFGYGYISTKIQQRQNHKRLQKFEEKAERKKQSLPQDKKPKRN